MRSANLCSRGVPDSTRPKSQDRSSAFALGVDNCSVALATQANSASVRAIVRVDISRKPSRYDNKKTESRNRWSRLSP